MSSECKNRLVKTILTAPLFPKLDGMLLELLRSLTAEEWEKQTVSPKWKVKDVAAHLLDTALRGVSIGARWLFAGSSEHQLCRRIGGIHQPFESRRRQRVSPAQSGGPDFIDASGCKVSRGISRFKRAECHSASLESAGRARKNRQTGLILRASLRNGGTISSRFVLPWTSRGS